MVNSQVPRGLPSHEKRVVGDEQMDSGTSSLGFESQLPAGGAEQDLIHLSVPPLPHVNRSGNRLLTQCSLRMK